MPARPASRSKRGAIPVWDEPVAVEQRDDEKERERDERDRMDCELSEIAERVVYQVSACLCVLVVLRVLGCCNLSLGADTKRKSFTS